MNKRFNNTEEYKAELAIKNSNLEVIDSYVNTTTKILHRCKIHDIKYYAKPESVLNGKGCPQCHFDNISKAKTKTHEWYLSELKCKNPYVIPMEPYINMKTRILHKCLIHNIKWLTTPSNTLLGCGCSKCLADKINAKNTKPNDMYLPELKEKQINIMPLETYKGTSINILHKCLTCNYEWMVRPANILSGKKCPKCCGNLKRTHSQYVEFLASHNPNIEVLGEYVNAHTAIKHRCNIHNIVWNVVPSFILNGGGCYYCGIEKLSQKARKSNKTFANELSARNPDVMCIGQYKTNITKIKVKCRRCNFEWEANPSNLLKGSGCPKCKQSKGEIRIAQWLQKHDIKYVLQKTFNDCKDTRVLPFDFYLPAENSCIEYDGKQHFDSIDYFGGQLNLQYTQRHDKIKTKYCEENNISLLRIPYCANVEEELSKFLLN